MVIIYLISIVLLILAAVSFTITTMYYNGKLLIKPKTFQIFLVISMVSAMLAGNMVSQIIKALV
jgi:hypothetical protein